MLQITGRGVVFIGTDADLDLMRRCMDQQHFMQLKQFIHPSLLSLIIPHLNQATFLPAHPKSVGSELLMEPNIAADTLSFLFNDDKLHEIVKQITGCNSVGHFQGRIFKLVSNPDHVFDWHDDMHDPDRLIAMSINLSSKKYRGGLLQIREVNSGKIVGEIQNNEFGSAVLFRVSETLEHRVTGIDGDAPRISFAGWFKSGQGNFRSNQASRP